MFEMTAVLKSFGEEMRRAREHVAREAVLTPLVESSSINERVGTRVLLKLECMQRTGSFKFRGAYHKVASLPPREMERGVVATSSGNHAQALAAAAKLFGVPATLAMPFDTPAFKLDRVRRWGATIVHYDRYRDDESAVGEALARERGAARVHPFDDASIISGQATVGTELFEQAASRGVRVDAMLVPCGGGGLTAGVALAARATSPETQVFAIEPEHYDDTARSLRSGAIVANAMGQGHRTLCDALMVAQPGTLTFDINRQLLSGVAVVSDVHVREALRLLVQELRLVVEPAGAIGLAALLAAQVPVNGACAAVIVSGGNIALPALEELIIEREAMA
jgi:threonine dehydratase